MNVFKLFLLPRSMNTVHWLRWFIQLPLIDYLEHTGNSPHLYQELTCLFIIVIIIIIIIIIVIKITLINISI